MIFQNLTLFQNILFVMGCLGIVLIIAYAIFALSGFHKHKKIVNTDDIDDNQENFESVNGFLFNAFTIRGSIFCFTIATSVAFMLSIYLPIWLSIFVGLFLGAIVAIIVAFFDRTPLGQIGELGVVSVKIPAKAEGFGKVILIEDNSEIDAEAVDKAIKKGKKVIIVERQGNRVLVKKFKKVNDGRRKI
ncbi:MAG: NfeD family protein [Clostridia bacterium]|nr:NfeD family protein [Clostridia bacterium]